MSQHLSQKHNNKVQDKYWNYVSKCISSCKDAMPIEKYQRYIKWEVIKMSKQTIEWHETGLKNTVVYYERKIKELERLESELEKMKVDIDFKQEQIRVAKLKEVVKDEI